MADLDFSTVVATDKNYIPHLKTAWKSWVLNRPEIIMHPMMILIDERDQNQIPELQACLNHHDLSFVLVGDLAGADQREKMLTALVKCPELIKTKWMLKLDCDVLAREYHPDWCSKALAEVCCGVPEPEFIAPSWGYTKPANAVQFLDDWADKHEVLKAGKRLNLIGDKDTVRTPGRIISYVFFGQKRWLKWAADQCGARLPIPSQDTYHWYLARRMGHAFKHMDAHKAGWQHIRGAKMEAELANLPKRVEIPESMRTGKNNHRTSFPALLKQVFEGFGGSMSPMNNHNLVGVEVGVDTGELSACLVDAFPQMILHLVDPWDVYDPSSNYYRSGDQRARRQLDGYHACMAKTIRHVAHAWQRIRLWKMPSVEAASKFPERPSVDWVFLDAQHTYEAVMEDAKAWWPKIKEGGLLSGHDAFHIRERRNKGFGVGKAITEFAKSIGKELQLHADTVWSIRK